MSAAEAKAGEAILAAAAELIGERGYNATTTRAIAERAGVNEVTLFRHFKNKQGILAALAETWAPRMAGFAVGAVPEPGDTRGTLARLAEMEVAQATAIGGVAMRLAMDAASMASRIATPPIAVACATSISASLTRAPRVSPGSGTMPTANPAMPGAHVSASAARMPCLFLKCRKSVTSFTPARSAIARVVVAL